MIWTCTHHFSCCELVGAQGLCLHCCILHILHIYWCIYILHFIPVSMVIVLYWILQEVVKWCFLVYSVNCLQCLLLTRTNWVGGQNTLPLVWDYGLQKPPLSFGPSMELGGYPLQTPGCHALISNGFYQKAKHYWLPTYIMTSHTHTGVKRWQLSADKCMGNQNTSRDLPVCYTTNHLHAMVIVNWRGGLFVKYVRCKLSLTLTLTRGNC